MLSFFLLASPAAAQITTHGITLSLTDSENLVGNLAGGVKSGATLQGVATATLNIDTGKAFNLPGGSIHISALQLHGRPLSGPYLDNLQAANGNEGEDSTRLWELWVDQSFGNTDIKLGQQSIDNEFMISQYSGLFINTMAGWPLIPSDDLYGGGPAYPLSALGARLLVKPTGNLTLLAGVFDDNPGGGAFSDDAQHLDLRGGKFNLHTGALFIAEIQFAKPSGLPGTYKLGFWDDTGFFPDQHSASPRMIKGDYSAYAVMDQTLWQSTADSARNLNLFTRIMGAPDAQNLIDFSLNGGVTLAAPLPGRDADQAGIDLGLGHVSPRPAGTPRQGTEALFELTYQAQVTQWLNLQPDMQYVINPGGGVLDPDDPSRNLRNEFVAGVRANLAF